MAGHSNGWSDIPSKKEENKKGVEKTMGEKIGRKKFKKRRKKGEVNKTKGKREKEGGGGWGRRRYM